jgi:PAS domain S-box-containing protein
MTEARKNKRIIIVDDEEMVIASIKNFLILETDYEVLAFTSPAKALEAIKEKPVSIAISDFLMPEIDGIKFLKEVKNHCPTATLILLTGYADKENAIKAINEVGIYKYIEKPWDNEDLKITIDNAFERTDLINKLEDKINELNIARTELEQYNQRLEDIVKERTKELTIANAELDAIIQSTADGIFTINDNFKILTANPALAKLKGCKLKDIIQKPISEIINYNSVCFKDGYTLQEPCIDSKCQIYNIELSRNIPVELSIAPIMTDDKVFQHQYVVVARDITAQKETERLREDFIATLTHDLRTPLLAAIQTLNFFLDGTLGELTDKQQTLLETMRASNKDMLGLVNALLEVYKYESGELMLIKDKFLLNDLIHNCLQEVKSLTHKKNITIDTDLQETELCIFADKKELRRVLANYLGNAINYTPVNGFITVHVEKHNSTLTVSVTDTGRGIPEADLKKLFQRFSQGTSKQRSTGTGLGLYLSRQIIEAHKGKVWAKSKENAGSTFGFSIPIKEIEEDNE